MIFINWRNLVVGWDGHGLLCIVLLPNFLEERKEINLAWEVSLSSWMFLVTSGGTSWSGGCLEQQTECLRKICVQWHLLLVNIVLWVCICVQETETWRHIPEVLCLLFVQCEWLQFFLRGAHLSALVLVSKGFILEGSTKGLLRPIHWDTQQSRAGFTMCQ